MQIRGHCPHCARVHAIVGGRMAKHGYDVKLTYFRGVCGGQHHAPIEVCRREADARVVMLKNLAANQDTLVEMLRSGERTPPTVRGDWDVAAKAYREVPFAEANEWEQKQAVDTAIYRHEHMARCFRVDAETLANLIERVHGQPLQEVVKPAPPPPILAGERRVTPNGKTLTARWVSGAKVRWTREDGFMGNSTTRAWRAFKVA
jgi:hypothetical protein